MTEDLERRLRHMEDKVNQNTTQIQLLAQHQETTNRSVRSLAEEGRRDRKDHRNLLKGIDNALRGKDEQNPGLFVKVSRIEQDVVNLDADLKKHKEKGRWTFRTLVGALISAIAGWVISFFKG